MECAQRSPLSDPFVAAPGKVHAALQQIPGGPPLGRIRMGAGKIFCAPLTATFSGKI
jgi:hypothetical protein